MLRFVAKLDKAHISSLTGTVLYTIQLIEEVLFFSNTRRLVWTRNYAVPKMAGDNATQQSLAREGSP